MTRSVLFLSLCAALCASVLQAQTTTPSFVYVSNTPVNSSNNYINGYTVAPDGSLTVIDGTPYYAEETDITVAQNTLRSEERRVGKEC